jgi:hypothetical protein
VAATGIDKLFLTRAQIWRDITHAIEEALALTDTRADNSTTKFHIAATGEVLVVLTVLILCTR